MDELSETTDRCGVLDANESFAQLALDAIEADPDQHRREVDEAGIRELASSIEQVGLRNAPEVYAVAFDEAGKPTRYRILCGERRYLAFKLLGRSTITCRVVPAPTRLHRERAMRAENAAREDLSILDDAYSLHRVIEAELAADPGLGRVAVMKHVAAREGLSTSELYDRVRLLEAPECLREALRASGGGKLSRAQAYSLMRKWREVETGSFKPARAAEARKLFQAVERFARKDSARPSAQRRIEDVSAETLPAYAAERGLDPKKVGATLELYRDVMRRAEDLGLIRFGGQLDYVPLRS